MSVPAYLTRKRLAAELDMSPDMVDRYVREGVLPAPKIHGGLKRWRWAEVVAALECGAATCVNIASEDPFSEGVERVKAAAGAAKIRHAGDGPRA